MNTTYKFILISAVSLLPAAGVQAKQPSTIEVKKAEFVATDNVPASLTKGGGNVKIAFDLGVAEGSLSTNEAYIITPELRNGTWRQELPVIAIEGRSYKIGYEEHKLFKDKLEDTTPYAERYVYDDKGMEIHYRIEIPFLPQMRGAELIINREICRQCKNGKCNKDQKTTIAANGIVDFSDFFTFNQSLYLFTGQEKGSFSDNFGNTSVFELNSPKIYQEAFAAPYAAFLAKMNELKERGAEFPSVAFTISSSPDGGLWKNDQLATQRVETIKQIVSKDLSFIEPSAITYTAIPENWTAFKEAISGTPFDTKIVARYLKDYIGDPDTLELILARMQNGDKYKEIYQSLRNCTVAVSYLIDHIISDELQTGSTLLEVKMGAKEQINIEQISANLKKVKNAYTLNNMLVAYTQHGDFEQALACAEQISNKDINPIIANNKAVLYTYLQDYPMAKTLFEKASKAPAVNYNKALLALNKENYKEAADLFGKCDCINSIAAHLAAGRYEQAAALTHVADPVTAEILYLRALAYSYTESDALTLRTLKSACELDSRYKAESLNQSEFIRLRGNAEFAEIVNN